MKKIQILGRGFDPVTMEEAQARLADFVAEGNSHLVITANPEMVIKARGDQLLAEIMDRADLVVADGIGVVWASRVLGKPVPERIPGIELAEGLLAQASRQGWKVFLLGGSEGVAEEAAQSLQRSFPEIKIVGTCHGYFSSGEEGEILKKIDREKPHILLAALGVPRQEKWLAAYLGTLKIPVAIGVGGSFNVWAGVDKRAPLWIRKVNLEWLYRVIKQPWRIKRLAALPIFALAVIWSRFKQGR
ncbi:MAG: WecB/TagA/CpsF family glycosyltransferase [Firmicutes bacterium]|nr:WecB/TagA/CpsF family glycosyltransferase [Bacillota bacterium]